MRARGCSQLQIHRCSMLTDGDKLSKYWQSLLCKRFWQPARFNLRKQWILNQLKNVQSHRVSFQIKHAEDRKWLVPDLSGRLVEVTRQYFLRTVAFKWDSVYCVLLKNYYLSRNTYIYNKFASRSGRCVDLRRVIFMHIKSYLRKYSCVKKSKDRVRQVYDYSLLRRVFCSFKAKYPFLAASFSNFRIIFHAVLSVIAVDNTCLSIMPDVSLLKQAYQKCDLSNMLIRDSSMIDNNSRIHPQLSTSQGSIHGWLQPKDLVANNPAREMDNDNLSPTYSENMSFLIRNEQKINRQNPGVKEATNVILHLDIQNDLVINLNTKDNDTDCDRQEVTASVVKKRMIDIPSYNYKIVPFHDNTCNTGLKLDPAGIRHTLLPVCRCKRKCFTKLCEPRTRVVCESFSQLKDSAEEKKWIMRHVQKSDEKQWSRHKKKEARNYFLTDWRGRRVKVCSGYFQRVLWFTNGSLQEPLIDRSDHHHEAGLFQDDALITGHQRDSQSTISFPGNSGRDFHHDGFCNMDQSHGGSARNINISSPNNKGRNLDTSQYTHIDNSSERRCQKDAANNKGHNLDTSQYTHIDNSSERRQKDAANNKGRNLHTSHYIHIDNSSERRCQKDAANKKGHNLHTSHYIHIDNSSERSCQKDAANNKGHNLHTSHYIHIDNSSERSCQKDAANNKGHNLHTSHYIHIDNSSERSCQRDAAKNSIINLINNDSFGRRTFKKDVTEKSITKHIHNKDCQITSCKKGIGKDCIIKRMNNDNCNDKQQHIVNASTHVDACICSNKDVQQDSTGNSRMDQNVHSAGRKSRGQDKNSIFICTGVGVAESSSRSERNNRSKDKRVGGVDICNASGWSQNRDCGNRSLNNDGCKDASQRKSVGNDNVYIDVVEDCDCCNTDLSKDNSGRIISIAHSRKRCQAKCINEDRTVKSIKMCCVSTRSQDKDSTNTDVNLDGSKKRGRRKDTRKDRTVSSETICSSDNKNKMKNSSVPYINIDGCRSRGRRKDTRKDRTVNSETICNSENKNEMKNSSVPDTNIDGCRSRGRRKDIRKDRTTVSESISSSDNKSDMKDSLIPNINIAGTRNRGCGRNIDKERSNVREYIEQHDRQLGRAATRSRDRAVQKLHQGFLSCYPSSRISYEEFRRICDQVHIAGLASMGSVTEDKVGSDVSGTLRSVLESRSVTRRMRSSLVGGESHEFEVPEGRRRRSTRITRVQSTMVEEDGLLQVGMADSDAFVLECAHEDLQADQQPGSGCSKGRLTFHSKPRVAAKQSLDKSEKLMGSRFVTSGQHSEHSHSDKQEMNVQLSQHNQPTLRSRELPRNKDGSRASKKCNISRHTIKEKIKKKAVKESISVNLTKDKGGHFKSYTNSKKLCKLSTLKKKDKHPMLPPCNCSRRRCIENIPEDRRKEIHDQFWNLSSYKDRKRWLMKYVEKRERKSKVLSLFPQRKNEHKRYFLPDDKSNVVEVCRLFFIHTLGFKWDSVVDAVVRTKISSCDAVGHTSHQLKKLPRQLPDYVVESVTEYLISVRNSCDVTNETRVKNLFDEDEAEDWNTETVCYDDEANELPRLKVKDLFKSWKIKYKSLKFNLGYHSFRRIFQSVIDPVLVSQEKVTKDNQNTLIKDVYSTADVDHPPPSETPNTYSNITDYQQTSTAVFSEKQSGQSNPDTNLEVHTYTESVNDSDLTISAKNESENLKVDSKSICQGDECIDLINCSGLHENLPDEDENGILDVGSGFFKRADDCKNTSRYPYTSKTKYKKRRSMSMRNDRSNYPVLPPCKCRKRKCAEKFTEPQRQQINTMFWDLGSYNERKQWILEHIKRADIKRRIVLSEGTPRKLESRWYYLPDADGNKVDVCKGFFLRTLGYRWDSVIDTIGKTTPKGVKWAAPDRRGRKPPPHKISDEAVTSMALYIENVCNTYQPVCHKRNQDDIKECKTSTGGQIPLGLTMKQLFVDYKSKHPNHKFGYESFRKIFRRVHGEFVASLPPDLESSEKPDIVNSKMNASDDKDYPVGDTCSVEKGFLVSKDCSMEKDYSVDEDYLVGIDYPVGKDRSLEKDYLVVKDCSLEKDYSVVKDCSLEKDNPVDKDCSVEKDYLIGKVYSVRTDYPVGNDCSVEQDYLVDKNYSEATNERCSGNFSPEDSHFAPVVVSYSETKLPTPPQSAPTPLPPPVLDNHHQPTQQHQVGSLALEHRSCLYQSHHHTSDHQHHLPVMQIPDRIEPLAPDHYSSVDNDPLMMYNHNLYCPPTAVSGHFTHVSDHLGHMSGVNPHTNIDVATCRAQSQFPAYFVSNPEPLQHQMYQMTSQYQSILHHIAESSRLFNYGYPPAENTFHEASDKHNLFRKQDFHRNNMNCCNIPRTSYSHVSEPASVQAQYHPQNHLVYTNTQPESTSTILSPYSDENDKSFAQDHQQIPSATFNQNSIITGFSNGFPSRMDSKESASKVKIPTKKSKSEKQKVKKEMKMKPKSLRNYGGHYPMLGPCNCKKKKCTEKFSEEARQKLHDMFWDLKDYNERKQWMLQHIKREDCKRRRIDQFESFRKLESRWYFFPDESGKQHEVCKDFFLRTLGYKWDSVIDTIRRTTPKGETTTRPDQRGRKAPAHKLCGAVLRSVVQYIKSMQQVSQPLDDHVESVEDLNCEQGHQRPIDSSSGQIAVPYGLTMKDLYDDYKVKHAAHKIGYESFRRIFRAVYKSEKIIFDDKTDEDEFLGPNDQDLVDF